MKNLNKMKALLVVFILGLPFMALAQNDTIPVPNYKLPGATKNYDARSIIDDIILTILLPIAGTIAVLFLIIGGFQYMFAGANEKLAEKGKTTIRNAVTGLAIVILSYIIVTIVVNTLM